MAWPTTFANLAGGNQPLSIFDVMFAQVAQMIAIPCSASGQNAVTLSPIGNAPILANYSFGNFFRFIAAQTSNAAITAQFTTLGFVNVYKADGVTQAGSGDQVQGQEYVYIYNPTLNSNAGGFYLENAAVPASVPAAGGLFRGTIKNNAGTPNTKLDISATELVMNNAAGAPLRSLGSSFTIDFGTTGQNGIDTGAIAATKDYFIWAISNGSTVAGLASLSSTVGGLVLPGGFNFTKRIGCWKTPTGTALLIAGLQSDRTFQYVVGGNAQTPNIPKISSASTGSVTVPTYTSIPVTGNGSFVPTTATKIRLMLSIGAGGAAGAAIVAPNGSYGAVDSTTNPPYAKVGLEGSVTFNAAFTPMFDMVLESGNIFYASNSTAQSLWCPGWEDSV